MELKQIMRLSKSRTLVYLDCPKKFFYSYILELPRLPNKYFKRGNEVHNVLDKVYQDWTNPTKGDEFIPYMTNKIIEIAGNDLYNEHKIYFDNFVKLENLRWNMCKNTKYFRSEPEVTIENKVGVSTISIIDKVERDEDGNVIIVDYKTSKVEKIDSYLYELYFYARDYYYKFGVLPKKVAIMGLTNCRRVEAEVSKKDIDKVGVLLTKIHDNITAETFPIGSKPNCFWCDYKNKCGNYGK